jgi:hypothetical protein
LQIIGGKARKKETLGRPNCRGVANTEMDLGDKGWTHLAQDMEQWKAFLSEAINIRIL